MMANYQLVFITRNRHRRKVKFFNFKRLKLPACLMLFFLSFGLTQNIANAVNNSSNSNDVEIDLLDCNYDEQVRLFIDPLFCIKRGYEEEKTKEEKTKEERAKEVSAGLATFVKSKVNLEYLKTTPYLNCSKDLSTGNSLQTCPKTGFSLSYKNLEEENSIENTITTFEPKDICLWLLEINECQEDSDIDDKLKLVEKQITDLEKEILSSIKTAVKNFRKPQCKLKTQEVTIKLNKLEGTLFCIETSIRDDENISERVERVKDKIEKIRDGEINVEFLGIVKVSDLKEKFGISEFENLTDSTQEENTDDNLETTQSLAIVSYQEKLSQDDRIIFILTKLDLELINSKDNKYSTVLQAINHYFDKIVTLVRISDNKEPKEVYFDWGPYKNNFYDILFRRFNSLQKQQPIEYQEYLFPVDDKAEFYNPSYRAVTIGNNISTLANDRWRIFSNPKLDIKHEENQSIIRIRNDSNEGDLTIMTIAEDDPEKDDAQKHSLTIAPIISQAIHMYRYNQWLVLEMIFLSGASAVYFFCLDKTK